MDADTRLAVRPGTYEIDPVRSAVRFTATARVDRYAFLTTGRGLIGRYVDVAVEVWTTAA